MVAHAQLLLEAAETINSSLDSPALETTILGEATRLIGADASALLVSRGDVLVAQEVLGLSDRFRSSFLVPLETSVSRSCARRRRDPRRGASGGERRRW